MLGYYENGNTDLEYIGFNAYFCAPDVLVAAQKANESKRPINVRIYLGCELGHVYGKYYPIPNGGFILNVELTKRLKP